jgi:hypothetical protein
MGFPVVSEKRKPEKQVIALIGLQGLLGLTHTAVDVLRGLLHGNL